MKCIIVDDNTMARMALKQLVSQLPVLELVAECSDATELREPLASQARAFRESYGRATAGVVAASGGAG